MADEQTGHELRRFFLELLQDTNLRDYHEGRGDYIRRRVRTSEDDEHRYLGDEAVRLLESDDVAQIEESIMLVTGSGKAVPIWVVSPPQ
jgi:hypothetical protein